YGESRDNGPVQGQHAIVMRRFRRVVEENPGEPLYIPHICKAIAVSERTLRICCQEHLGMGPKRYLLLRRMHLARETLRRSAAGTTSVTDTATRYGFWQLGRFVSNTKPCLASLRPPHFIGNLTSSGINLPKLHSRARDPMPRVEARASFARSA